ncbi:hypothetical protein/Bgh-specific BIG4 precursor [Blumeria hordei DH14]|uniref:Secreted effector protein n=1 Tax=Blumeria graminis f. sp. hordei (strain DH14) TaxID=546991 RepID=N1J7G0_BLUG1|nr:hypothetical protein/Bgh-specific BIG4 precursor [Blumeria hordei DH14]
MSTVVNAVADLLQTVAAGQALVNNITPTTSVSDFYSIRLELGNNQDASGNPPSVILTDFSNAQFYGVFEGSSQNPSEQCRNYEDLPTRLDGRSPALFNGLQYGEAPVQTFTTKKQYKLKSVDFQAGSNSICVSNIIVKGSKTQSRKDEVFIPIGDLGFLCGRKWNWGTIFNGVRQRCIWLGGQASKPNTTIESLHLDMDNIAKIFNSDKNEELKKAKLEDVCRLFSDSAGLIPNRNSCKPSIMRNSNPKNITISTVPMIHISSSQFLSGSIPTENFLGAGFVTTDNKIFDSQTKKFSDLTDENFETDPLDLPNGAYSEIYPEITEEQILAPDSTMTSDTQEDGKQDGEKLVGQDLFLGQSLPIDQMLASEMIAEQTRVEEAIEDEIVNQLIVENLNNDAETESEIPTEAEILNEDTTPTEEILPQSELLEEAISEDISIVEEVSIQNEKLTEEISAVDELIAESESIKEELIIEKMVKDAIGEDAIANEIFPENETQDDKPMVEELLAENDELAEKISIAEEIIAQNLAVTEDLAIDQLLNEAPVESVLEEAAIVTDELLSENEKLAEDILLAEELIAGNDAITQELVSEKMLEEELAEKKLIAEEIIAENEAITEELVGEQLPYQSSVESEVEEMAIVTDELLTENKNLQEDISVAEEIIAKNEAITEELVIDQIIHSITSENLSPDEEFIANIEAQENAIAVENLDAENERLTEDISIAKEIIAENRETTEELAEKMIEISTEDTLSDGILADAMSENEVFMDDGSSEMFPSGGSIRESEEFGGIFEDEALAENEEIDDVISEDNLAQDEVFEKMLESEDFPEDEIFDDFIDDQEATDNDIYQEISDEDAQASEPAIEEGYEVIPKSVADEQLRDDWEDLPDLEGLGRKPRYSNLRVETCQATTDGVSPDCTLDKVITADKLPVVPKLGTS